MHLIKSLLWLVLGIWVVFHLLGALPLDRRAANYELLDARWESMRASLGLSSEAELISATAVTDVFPFRRPFLMPSPMGLTWQSKISCSAYEISLNDSDLSLLKSALHPLQESGPASITTSTGPIRRLMQMCSWRNGKVPFYPAKNNLLGSFRFSYMGDGGDWSGLMVPIQQEPRGGENRVLLVGFGLLHWFQHVGR